MSHQMHARSQPAVGGEHPDHTDNIVGVESRIAAPIMLAPIDTCSTIADHLERQSDCPGPCPSARHAVSGGDRRGPHLETEATVTKLACTLDSSVRKDRPLKGQLVVLTPQGG